MSLTMPSRRGFLAGILAACAAPVIVRAESLMAVKPALLIPAAEPLTLEVYGNTLLTPAMITREALKILHAKLNFISRWDREYGDIFATPGQTLKIRLPQSYAI